jgi:hypothetical protein
VGFSPSLVEPHLEERDEHCQVWHAEHGAEDTGNLAADVARSLLPRTGGAARMKSSAIPHDGFIVSL